MRGPGGEPRSSSPRTPGNGADGAGSVRPPSGAPGLRQAARSQFARKSTAGSLPMSMMVMNRSWAMSSMISGVTSSIESLVLW